MSENGYSSVKLSFLFANATEDQYSVVIVRAFLKRKPSLVPIGDFFRFLIK